MEGGLISLSGDTVSVDLTSFGELLAI